MHSPAIGKTIRRLRIEKNISQEKLAEMLELSFQQVQKYEYGRSKITIDRASQIAEALDVPLLNLLGCDFPMSKDTNRIYDEDVSPEELRILKAFRTIKHRPLKKSILVILKDLAKGRRSGV